MKKGILFLVALVLLNVLSYIERFREKVKKDYRSPLFEALSFFAFFGAGGGEMCRVADGVRKGIADLEELGNSANHGYFPASMN